MPLLTWNLIIRREKRYEWWLATEPTSNLLGQRGFVAIARAITSGRPSAQRGQHPFGIILINFEAVQGISRTLGRELQEKVIAAAARRVIDAYGKDRASLLSDQDIAIILPGLTEADALAATEAAVGLLTPIIEVGDIPFTIEPAGGAALSPKHGENLDTLLIKAGLAADESRRKRRSATLYVPESTDLAEHRITLLRELHAVLRDSARLHEIAIVYQPQVQVTTGELIGVEALLRWTHPQWGPVPPDELIEAVEPSEVMHELTQHVLQTVVAQMRRWNEQGESFRVSANVSIQDLHQADFAQELGNLLRRHGIADRRLLVEITETTLIADTERVSRAARTLAKQGVGLSLDDFGTGYASLQQLRELPLTEVKIDQSYVRGIADNPAYAAILTSLHQLAQALHIDVVAEGVEDQRTADVLAKLPGTICQGWHFGRPMTVEALQEWRRDSTANR
jgi:EAL domain-containing protein (putative c-di-GMP-specific phosphodiesterase class I)/GGDEF domain-containing protein